MSIKVMTAVWPLPLPAFDKLVLLALADTADDEGRCYPSLIKLVGKCGMSERTIQRSLDRLEKGGQLIRERRDGRSTVFHVTPVTVTPPSDRHPCHTDTPVSLTPTPVSLTPPEKKKTSSLEPSLNRQSRTRRSTVDEPPPSNLNVEAWHRWVEYRKQIRKPIHPASWSSAQRKLAAFGPDQAAVVEQSIAETYQGLFPLKQKPKQEVPPRGMPVLNG